MYESQGLSLARFKLLGEKKVLVPGGGHVSVCDADFRSLSFALFSSMQRLMKTKQLANKLPAWSLAGGGTQQVFKICLSGYYV